MIFYIIFSCTVNVFFSNTYILVFWQKFYSNWNGWMTAEAQTKPFFSPSRPLQPPLHLPTCNDVFQKQIQEQIEKITPQPVMMFLVHFPGAFNLQTPENINGWSRAITVLRVSAFCRFCCNVEFNQIGWVSAVQIHPLLAFVFPSKCFEFLCDFFWIFYIFGLTESVQCRSTLCAVFLK